MGTEIERKFLVVSDGYTTSHPVEIRQGYLSRQRERIVRIRLAQNDAYITIKGLPQGITRIEHEYPIPTTDAAELLELCEQPIIEKKRHSVQYAGKTWEVDVFEGANAGLVLAEIELNAEDEPFEKPDWVGKEVTDDPRYNNSNLSLNPYSTW